MEHRFLKDFVISLAVLLSIAFLLVNFMVHLKRINNIPQESKHIDMRLSTELENDIKNLDQSIRDRKEFIFTVEKDPLEQNLIVKTKKDIFKQWQEEVYNTIRLASTIIDENGNKTASIEYQGKNELYKIGDKIAGRKITNIRQGELDYVINGNKGTLKLMPIPPKPVEISNKKENKLKELNW